MKGGSSASWASGATSTERVQLEQQLRQAQKMEAVGRLAAASPRLQQHPHGHHGLRRPPARGPGRATDPRRQDADEIHKAADRWLPD